MAFLTFDGLILEIFQAEISISPWGSGKTNTCSWIKLVCPPHLKSMQKNLFKKLGGLHALEPFAVPRFKNKYFAEMCRNVKRFRGGLVMKANRLLYHSTLVLRAMKGRRSSRMDGGREVPHCGGIPSILTDRPLEISLTGLWDSH